MQCLLYHVWSPAFVCAGAAIKLDKVLSVVEDIRVSSGTGGMPLRFIVCQLCAAVLLCCCAAVLLCCCAAVLLCCCAAVLLCCCACCCWCCWCCCAAGAAALLCLFAAYVGRCAWVALPWCRSWGCRRPATYLHNLPAPAPSLSPQLSTMQFVSDFFGSLANVLMWMQVTINTKLDDVLDELHGTHAAVEDLGTFMATNQKKLEEMLTNGVYECCVRRALCLPCIVCACRVHCASAVRRGFGAFMFSLRTVCGGVFGTAVWDYVVRCCFVPFPPPPSGIQHKHCAAQRFHLQNGPRIDC
jgi:hypothetical protein